MLPNIPMSTAELSVNMLTASDEYRYVALVGGGGSRSQKRRHAQQKLGVDTGYHGHSPSKSANHRGSGEFEDLTYPQSIAQTQTHAYRHHDPHSCPRSDPCPGKFGVESEEVATIATVTFGCSAAHALGHSHGGLRRHLPSDPKLRYKRYNVRCKSKSTSFVFISSHSTTKGFIIKSLTMCDFEDAPRVDKFRGRLERRPLRRTTSILVHRLL